MRSTISPTKFGSVTPEGAEVLKIGSYGVKLRFDTRTTPVDKVLSQLTDSGSVVDITISDPPLEEVIAKIYQTQDALLQPPASKLEEAPAQTDEAQLPEGMVLIPAGPFIYGEGEKQRTITLRAFWMDIYEVTNGRYAELRVIEYDPIKGYHPVTNVPWHQARQFCLAKGKRLPTEQEWEKAARGTDGRFYPWGNTYEPGYVNAENRLGGSTSVGRFEEGRSAYGLYDMAVNVMEWTDSDDNETKVYRGGSWASSPQDVRTTSRSSISPGFQLVDLGFRCAKDGPR